MKKTLLLPFYLLFFIPFVQAQWTTDTLLNTTVHDTAGILSPLMASLPNGNTYVVWYEYGGSNLNLRMQLLDSNGYKLWAPGGILVSNYPQTSSTSPYDLKIDNEGNAIVAFQDTRTGGLNIVAYKVDVSGSLLWGASGVSLIDPSSQEGIGPSVAIVANDDVVVAWTADSASAKWIAAQRLSPSGIPKWNTTYRVRDTVTNLKYSRAKLLPSVNNDIQMLFVEENGSFPTVTSTIYAQQIDTTGNNIWTPAKKVSTKTIPYFVFPQPVYDNAGGFYVAFNTSNPVIPSLNDVYAQHVDNAGNLWSITGTEAANSNTNHKSEFSSCLSSTSEFWVLLQIDVGGNYGVSVQKFDATGNVLLGPDALNVIPMNPVNFIPNTITDAVNGIIYTTSFGGFSNQHIEASKLDFSGLPVWTNTFVTLCAVNSNKDDVQAGDFINNNLVFVWSDDRNGSGVFAQNINGNGSTGITTDIFDHADQNNILFYPNPSEIPVIYFSASLKTKYTINIRDAFGKELASVNFSPSANSFSLNEYKNLSQGIYLVTISNSDSRIILRWIKN